jgi:hypothetical protein
MGGDDVAHEGSGGVLGFYFLSLWQRVRVRLRVRVRVRVRVRE